jgi:hypothetical protein
LIGFFAGVFQFCVRMTAVEGICTSGSPAPDHHRAKTSKCVRQRVEGSSSHLVTFSLLPLEIGLHNISFSLETSFGREILVKTLRVVVRKTLVFFFLFFVIFPQITSLREMRKGQFYSKES